MFDKKKSSAPVVVPVFKPLYDRIESLDLHAEKGLHGVDELIGMIDFAAADPGFSFLSTNAYRFFVAPLNGGRTLGVEGGVFKMHLGEGYMDSNWRDYIRTYHDTSDMPELMLEPIALDKIRKGLLDYVRFAPYNDAWSTYLLR